MPRPSWTLLLLCSLPGCGLFTSREPPAGRFELSRNDLQTSVSAPVTATWCGADSLLTVLAVTPDGAGGLSARLAWPPVPTDTLRVVPKADSLHTATLAWRSLQDSVSVALRGDSGVATLRGDSVLDGTFTAWATLFDTALVRLDGALRSVRVTRHCTAAQ